MMKFTFNIMIISVITLISSWLLGVHVAFAIYLLGSTIALLNYENLEA